MSVIFCYNSCLSSLGFLSLHLKRGIKRAGRTYLWNSWCSYLKQSALVDDPIKQITLPGCVIKNKRCSWLFQARLSTLFLTRWTQSWEGGKSSKKKRKTNNRQKKKHPKTVQGGIFPVNRKFQTKLPFWIWGNVCKTVVLFFCLFCLFVFSKKQTIVWLQSSAAPVSTFTFSLLADSSSATRSLCCCCCCCCHRARRTHSLRRHSTPVPD